MSSRNALKHGLLSKDLLSKGEDQEEYKTLLSEFMEDLQPVGILEESLVEKITQLCWRMRRVHRTEKSLIEAARVESTLSPGGISSFSDLAAMMKQDPTTVAALIESLRSCEGALQAGRRFSTREIESLRLYGGPNPYVQFLLKVDSMLSDPLFQQAGRKALDSLPQMIARLIVDLEFTMGIAKVSRPDNGTDKATDNANVLPDNNAIDRLMRYETSLDRAFYRALQQFERLRRIRKGGQLPAEVNVNLS